MMDALQALEQAREKERSRLAAAEKVCKTVGVARGCMIGNPCSICSNAIYAAYDEWEVLNENLGSND